MARIVGGLTTSHVPLIGKLIAEERQHDTSVKPFFDAFVPVYHWLERARPDVAIVIYNDHGLNFFLDTMPTFAIGTALDFPNADEGWGPPPPRRFKGAPQLAWHVTQSLVNDEFDMTTCQEMLLDHSAITALDLAWPGHGPKPVSVIPLVINAARAPLPTARRCHRLGQAIGRAVDSFAEDLDVFVIGSGGLSHHLGQSGYINEAFDHACMHKMTSDPEALTHYSNDEIIHLAGPQGIELMTWIAMRGALPGDARLVTSKYHAPISHTGGGMMLFECIEPVANDRSLRARA